MASTADTVRDCIRAFLPEGKALPADTTTLDQLGFDSLQVVELAIAIEDALELTIPESLSIYWMGATITQVIADVEKTRGER